VCVVWMRPTRAAGNMLQAAGSDLTRLIERASCGLGSKMKSRESKMKKYWDMAFGTSDARRTDIAK
jgi:hypothetical protein